MTIKIWFNTDYPNSSEYKWRVIEIKNNAWKELLAKEVVIKTESYTTSDLLPDGKTIKHHISVDAGNLIFEGKDGCFEKITIY